MDHFRYLTRQEVQDVCAERGCSVVEITPIALDIVWPGSPRHRPARPRTVEGIVVQDDDGHRLPKWSAAKILRACRRVRGRSIPSAVRPERHYPHLTLREGLIAESLALDGIAPYTRNGGRSHALRWILGERQTKPRDPHAVLDALVWCGLVSRLCKDPLSLHFQFWPAALRPKPLDPPAEPLSDDEIAMLEESA